MNIISYDDFISEGEINKRQNLLFERLHDTMYRPDNVFKANLDSWPGDWIGRTILALVSLARSLKKEPAYLSEIITKLNSKLNAKGYLGQIFRMGWLMSSSFPDTAGF